MMPVVVLAQTVAAAGLFEAWPASDGGLQHRMEGRVAVVVDLGPVTVEPWMALGRWMQRESKIPSSFLNLEAGRVMEFRYGATATVGLGPCRAGGWVGRRGVEWLGETRRWGEPLPNGEAGAWTIGYYDGVAPLASCGPVTVRGPLWRWHALTLPWHEWEAAVAGQVEGVTVDARLAARGPRAGTVWDLRFGRAVTSRLVLGVAVGQLEHPGWGRPVRRIAAVVMVGR